MQGVADGGMGFGDNGEYRVLNPDYNEPDIDAQGARPLTVLNVAYVTNTFWNGQFGAGYVNTGTEALWNEEDGTANNALGLEAIEAQKIEGLDVHRMEMSL
jgi:cytochrome c peroxidase